MKDEDLSPSLKPDIAEPSRVSPNRLRFGRVRNFFLTTRVPIGPVQRKLLTPSTDGKVIRSFMLLLRRISIFKASFICCVVIPALVVSLYFAFIASDQFATEARFAVRTAQFEGDPSGNIKPGVASGGSPVRVPSLAGQEAYVVAAYIRSAAIFDDFPKSLDLRAIFSRPEADFWARLKSNATREELLRYWLSMVDVRVNNLSGVVTVFVKAFRPEDSYEVALGIIHASEILVNRLSERARNDAVGRAEQEVRRNEQLVQSALRDMQDYRDSQQFIDPSSEATSTSTLLTRAMNDRIQLQSDYFVATRAMSVSAPSALVLKSRLDALDQQIEQLKARMTGPAERRTISAAIGKFEELELRRQFAERLYTMSQDALQRAKQKAEWQNIYLSVFVPPALAQLALFPERINMTLLIFAVLAIVWGILSLISAAIRDHMV
ncbi:capsule biosynthesis protein [Methylocella sp. CPCC 101449]|uniref:capsule biosynthesis protein n=1 Tax=Methylocella sp. CPCC 101449 TaxID=2987531 RepID=UPI0028910361|nr:capsule biosynthesis protein [Methylocella sp. CPCC 101449]MDT2019462.1 capsule biosynthesis protein [Methylocella sp. CPCC 101449]